MHYRLKPGGKLIYCSSDTRMSVRWDSLSFFDDRFLGINIRAEVEKLFEPIGDLFDSETLRANPVLHRMILGADAGTEDLGTGPIALAHPAIVYQRRPFTGQYFDVPPLRR
jgi:hypothetical protein